MDDVRAVLDAVGSERADPTRCEIGSDLSFPAHSGIQYQACVASMIFWGRSKMPSGSSRVSRQGM